MQKWPLLSNHPWTAPGLPVTEEIKGQESRAKKQLPPVCCRMSGGYWSWEWKMWKWGGMEHKGERGSAHSGRCRDRRKARNGSIHPFWPCPSFSHICHHMPALTHHPLHPQQAPSLKTQPYALSFAPQQKCCVDLYWTIHSCYKTQEHVT